ncbi:NUDIX domain-containing protein [Actinoplanes sp. NEAU-A12]|uniref:NUDIX domain-containing protein n=1 Tax=Actinoplanes sandaracinus TaxID=3045177 RepID=A0ABT6WZ96_9ACTN|nr:NUDIX domain-containing protein [Actinoplanes sandaracinus]MDI6105059.1 NUDIX domain-containing protein [Actinoplanes sandaracinus]
MDANDIEWTGDAGSFKYRSAAVIADGDRLLVCAVDGIDGWFLPGGKVNFGETSAAALVRELREELGIDVTVAGGPLLVTEGVRDEGGVIHQEVCFYYPVRWPGDVPPDAVYDRDGHRFRWARFADLPGLRFLPPEITGLLTDPAPGPRHLAFDRRGQHPPDVGPA